MKITKEQINQIRIASKLVTKYYNQIREEGLAPLADKLYKKEAVPMSGDEEAKRLLAEKIEKIHEFFKGNSYGCQEDRTRAIIGLAVTGNENTFKKGTVRSTEASFEPNGTEYPFMLVIPQRTGAEAGGHNYQVGHPILMTGKSRFAIKRDGSRGNCFFADMSAGIHAGANAEIYSPCSPEIVDTYFDQLLMLAEDPTDSTSVQVAEEFPLLTGELGRTLRKIIEDHKTFKAMDAILSPMQEA